MRPSALGARETETWQQMLTGSRSLQRAFLTPGFALACERATGRAYVAVLHDGSAIRGFLPFQFKTVWHERMRLAERIGGGLSDATGLVAWPDLRITAASLVRLAGLASLFVSDLVEGQDQFGLDAEWSQTCYLTDLAAGPDAYFGDLLARNRDLVRDTERRERKAQKSYGPLSFDTIDHIPADALASLIEAKAQQYRRTQVPNPFDRPRPLRLIEALNGAPAAQCRLVLARLRAGGRVVAQHLGLQYNDVLSWWFPAYDPDAQGVSPGRLLLWYIIRHAMDDGIRLIDYGEGEAQYKRQFSTRSIQLGRATWCAGPASTILARLWQSAEWRLRRRLLRRLRTSAEPT